ncbi:SH3 domain-containing protein [Streptomyces sp. NPDC096152]|uniref:SH3 domain-containing protein n=1 Tax=Streptomyces sp. NPDC096152 TaxID=3366078 RepID=UPI00381C943B
MRKGVRSALVGALTVALAVVGVTTVVAGGRPDRASGPAGAATAPGGDESRLVLISGRDDHGLVATARVALYGHPGDGEPVAQAKDGTLARVVSTEGTWLQVRAVGDASVHGWVDDFYLRGTVHLVGPGPTCRVRVGGQWLAAGEQAVVLDVRGTRAKVRAVRSGRHGWVARSTVRELAPESGCGRPTASASPEARESGGHGHRHG